MVVRDGVALMDFLGIFLRRDVAALIPDDIALLFLWYEKAGVGRRTDRAESRRGFTMIGHDGSGKYRYGMDCVDRSFGEKK